MQKPVFVSALLVFSTFAFATATASHECGGLDTPSLDAQLCEYESSSSYCDSYSCYSADGEGRSAYVSYQSSGGGLAASTSASSYESCYSSTSYYSCFRSDAVAAGGYTWTFVPFVGWTYLGTGAGMYGGESQSSNGSSCWWVIWAHYHIVPVSNACTYSMPPLP